MTTPLSVPRLYLVRDLFLFSCYTGISYGDMCRLTAANLETAEDGTVWIKATREKTNVEFEIPLLDLSRHIINKYRDNLCDGNHTFARRADGDGQPHVGTPTVDDHPNLCPCNGQKGGRGYEAAARTFSEPKARTL